MNVEEALTLRAFCGPQDSRMAEALHVLGDEVERRGRVASALRAQMATANDVTARYRAEVEHMRNVITFYVEDVSDGARFDALARLAPDLS